MTLSFAVTWDYRCPFARIVHDHVVEGLLDGADWDVTFVPFSLGQVHVDEGELPDLGAPRRRHRPAGPAGRRGGARHRPRPLPARAPGALRGPPRRRGPASATRPSSASCSPRTASTPTPCSPRSPPGEPLETVRDEHEPPRSRTSTCGACPPSSPAAGPPSCASWTCPVDAADARRSIERVVDLLTGWPELNEFKHTSLDR